MMRRLRCHRGPRRCRLRKTLFHLSQTPGLQPPCRRPRKNTRQQEQDRQCEASQASTGALCPEQGWQSLGVTMVESRFVEPNYAGRRRDRHVVGALTNGFLCREGPGTTCRWSCLLGPYCSGVTSGEVRLRRPPQRNRVSAFRGRLGEMKWENAGGGGVRLRGQGGGRGAGRGAAVDWG